MENLDNKIAALQKYLDNVSDVDFDKLIDEVDQMDISGPTVAEYMASLTKNTSLFFDDVSEESWNAEVEKLFSDTCIKGHRFDIPSKDSLMSRPAVLNSPQSSLYAGESDYQMAA